MTEKIKRKPPWIKFNVPGGPVYTGVKKIIDENRLHTICMEAHCPNIGECFSRGTATFLIMGDTCTRNCRYCSVNQGIPARPDMNEPEKIAGAISSLGLEYAVITSVTRDDLPDGGASLFAETVRHIRASAPECAVELLVPDFRGYMKEALDVIASSGPRVLNHNIEVVRSLYSRLRPMGDYRLSLELISYASQKGLTVKSGLMIGFGESMDDIEATLHDLRRSGCSLVTIGQYLQSKRDGYEVSRYYHPDEFEEIKKRALSMGFSSVASGPNVRSSYHASDMAGQGRQE